MKNYIIKSINGNSVLAVNTLGAELRSFKVNKTEFIWQRNTKIWGNSAPVLFPIVGELKGAGKTTLIDGKPYHMDIHGFARAVEFKVVKHTESSILLWFNYNRQTLKQYPYKFGFGVEFNVTDKGFTQTFIIENKSKCDMPFVVGAHPGFKLPMYNDSFEDYKLLFEKVERQGAYRIDKDGLVNDAVREKVFNGTKSLPLNHSLFDNGALLFEKLNSKYIKLINKEGKGIKISFADFNYFGIWQCPNKKAQYICLEPWTGMNDCYSEDGVYKNKRGVRFIKPKNTVKLSLAVNVL